MLSLAIRSGDAAAARVALALVRYNVPADALNGHLLQVDTKDKHFLHHAARKGLLNDAGFVAELRKLDGPTLGSLLTAVGKVRLRHPPRTCAAGIAPCWPDPARFDATARTLAPTCVRGRHLVTSSLRCTVVPTWLRAGTTLP